MQDIMPSIWRIFGYLWIFSNLWVLHA